MRLLFFPEPALNPTSCINARALPRRKLRPAQALPAPGAPRAQTPFERELTTKRRGEISELAFALAAARHGFGIARPYGDSERYDIILDCQHVDPSHLVSVIPTKAERKRAKWACPEQAKRAVWVGHSCPTPLTLILTLTSSLPVCRDGRIRPSAFDLTLILIFTGKDTASAVPRTHTRWGLCRRTKVVSSASLPE
jgi:PD-(D/E)XK endonuclease